MARVELPPPTALGVARLGLLSDSHDDHARTRDGVAALVERGAETLIHLGDIGTEEVLEELLVGGVPARVVFGNTDDDRRLARHAARLGIADDHPIGVYEAAGKIVVAHHGHFLGVERAAAGIDAAYYLHGHTHQARDEVVEGVRMINPGALHRARRYSVALLDVLTSELVFVRVD